MEYGNCSRRVVKIRFGIVIWILGPKLEIQLKQTLVNILSFDTQIGFYMVLVVLIGDFSAKMSYIIIFRYLGSCLAF